MEVLSYKAKVSEIRSVRIRYAKHKFVSYMPYVLIPVAALTLDRQLGFEIETKINLIIILLIPLIYLAVSVRVVSKYN